MWPFKKKTAIEKFWSWFSKNEDSLFHADIDAVLESGLSERLKAIHESLTWELSPPGKAPRELILSADGDKAAFSAVESLADAAPALPNWKFLRFRQRDPNYHESTLKIGEIVLGPTDIEAILLSNGVLIGIHLFIRGCPAAHDPHYVRAAFIQLDSCLGEYDMECKVGQIKVNPFDAEPRGDRILWADFRRKFDEAFEGLHSGE